MCHLAGTSIPILFIYIDFAYLLTFTFMATSTYVPQRVSPDSPLSKSYVIVEAQQYSKDPDITICKYVKRVKIGDNWEDKVFAEWVKNTEKIDLIGAKIVEEKSIVL